MSWVRWVVMALALVEGGWFAFDGTRALVAGDYVTPASGTYAGQLGPWAKLVEKAGIEPRSTQMKSIFAVYGFTWLLVIAGYAAGLPGTRGAMLAAAAGAVWYLPFGTLLSLLQVVLLLLPAARARRGG